MGHAINIYTNIKDSKDRKKLEKQILRGAREFAKINVDRGESPFGDYHGNMRLESGRIYKSESEAVEYLETKFGQYRDFAVPYYDTSKFENSTKALKNRAKKEELSEKLRSLDIKNSKSKTKTCKCCGKKVDLSKTENSKCTFCKKDLRNEKTVQKTQDLKNKISELDSDYKTLLNNATKKAKIFWAFKVEVHC